MSTLRSVLRVLLLIFGALGCSSSSAHGEACTPGAQVACSCPGDTTGAQVCTSDGSAYGLCQGCSTSEGTGGSTSDGGAGGTAGSSATAGSGGTSSTTQPEGAANYNFGTQPGFLKCAVPDATGIGAGMVDATTRSMVINGSDGFGVNCDVSGNETAYIFSGLIENLSTGEVFSIDGTINAASATATVDVSDSKTKDMYRTDPQVSCTVSIDTPSTSLEVQPGSIWGSFSCTRLYDADEYQNPDCSIFGADSSEPGGYFTFDNCTIRQ